MTQRWGISAVLCFFLIIPNALPYANFVAYGYKSCTACHYNAFGGGPLNDYGRALAATAISGKLLYPGASDEQVTKWSGFLGPKKMPFWISPSLDFRRLYWVSDFGESSKENIEITMNTELNLVLRHKKLKGLFYSLSYAFYPDDENDQQEQTGRIISRENYVGYKINDKSQIQAGIFDTVFGLRIPDHIAFSKILTGLAENDQTLGLAYHRRSGKLEGGVHVFLGNPNEEDSTVRQKGASMMGEYSVLSNVHLGGSFLYSQSDFLKKTIVATHGKVDFGKGVGLIGELGLIQWRPSVESSERDNIYLLTQGLIRISRGLHFSTTFEFNNQETTVSDTKSTTYRLAPGIQWFPVHRIEIKSELSNTKTISNKSVAEEAWDWYTNLHFYF